MNAHNRHYWLKSGTLNLVLNIQSLLFGFGSFFLLIRVLDKHSFGIWTLFIATTTIFETARNGLLQTALIKFLSSNKPEDHPAILSASFFISGVLMLFCILLNISLAVYLANIWGYPGLVQMFYMFSIVYIIQGVLSQFQWIEQAHLSFNGIVVSNMIKQGGFFFFVFYCLFWYKGVTLMNLVYVQGLCALLATIIEYYFIRNHLSFSSGIKKEWVTNLFNYGKFAFGTSVSSILSNTINQMMLGAMISADAAGVYNVAMRITNVADIPTNTVGSIVFPQSARRFAEQGLNAGKYMYEKSVGTILAFLIPGLVFVFVFPHFVENIIAGNKYADAIPIIKITIISCLFNPFQRIFGTIMDSMGKPQINFLMIFLFAALNLVLTYFFVEKYSIMGAVYATLATDFVFFIIMQVMLKKKFNVNLLHPFIYALNFYPEFFNHYIKPAYRKFIVNKEK